MFLCLFCNTAPRLDCTISQSVEKANQTRRTASQHPAIINQIPVRSQLHNRRGVVQIQTHRRIEQFCSSRADDEEEEGKPDRSMALPFAYFFPLIPVSKQFN